MVGQRKRLGVLAGLAAVLALLAVGFVAGCKKGSDEAAPEADAANAPVSPRSSATSTTAGPAATGTPAAPGAASGGATPAAAPVVPAGPLAGEEMATAAGLSAPEDDPSTAEAGIAKLLGEAAAKAGVSRDNAVTTKLSTAIRGPAAQQAVSAMRKNRADRATFVEVAARAMKAGALSEADKTAIRAIVKKGTVPPAKSGGPPVVTRWGLPQSDAEKTLRIQKFASLYGPVTWVREKDWSGTIIEWVTLTFNHQKLKIPLALIMDAPRLKMLEPYFRMYPDTGFSKVMSRQKVTGSPGLKALVLKEDEEASKRAQAAAVAAAAVVATPAAPAARATPSGASSDSGGRGRRPGRRSADVG